MLDKLLLDVYKYMQSVEHQRYGKSILSIIELNEDIFVSIITRFENFGIFT